MPHGCDPRALVLHGVRLKGFARVDQLADVTGLYPSEVTTSLEELRSQELVTHREGRVSGWALTQTGRQRDAELVAAELDRAGMRDRVDECYRRFLDVNHKLLGVCTEWQMRTVDGRQVLNDHGDDGYDRAVISRLRTIDGEIQPVCEALASGLSRFHAYGPRLSNALKKIESGETDWFTKPVIDSYHTIWFELHEDLLSTLGLERAKEGAS